jgi:hypothetical protein
VSGERVREHDRAGADASGDGGAPRQTVELGRAEALRLLTGATLGRIVFTRHALPAIRPVNHIVDQGDVIIRTREAATLSLTGEHGGQAGVVVAYEADSIDLESRLGWSVVVTGYAQLITDPRETARYQRLLRPWVEQDTDCTVRIRPNMVTGYRLVPAPADAQTPETAATPAPAPAPAPAPTPAPASEPLTDGPAQTPRA